MKRVPQERATREKAAQKRAAGRRRAFKNSLPLTLMALPGIIFIFVFNYIPLYGLILPFKDYKVDKGFLGSAWIGLKNFEFLFNGRDMLVAARNTILYNLVFIFVGTAVAVIIALLLFEVGKKRVKLYQTLLLLPYFVSWVVVAYIVKGFFDMDHGVFNSILSKFGKEPIMWYNEVKYWPAIIIIANIWKGMGYSAVVYYASLMGVDKELYEAAETDGAGKLRQMWCISLPMLKSVIVIMTILSIGKIFYGDFGLFYNLPLNSPILYPATDVIDTYVFRAMMVLGDVGMSSAACFFQSVLGFVLVLATNLIVRKVDSDNALF